MTEPDARRAGPPSAAPLVAFPPAHRRLVAGLVVAFAALVASGLHGYSISMWHKHVDGSPPVEIVFGEAQWTRMDDWMVQVPLSLAQRGHEPAFPVWNDSIGLGQQMLLPLHLPVAHVVTLFRPQEWGFFLGADAGLAWKWWLQAFGLFYTSFLVLWIVSRGRFGLAVAGSAFLVVSPFFQFWSMNAAPFVATAALVFVSACHVLLSPSRRVVAANALLLAWSAAAFALSLYPPYQVVLAQIVALLLVTTVADRVRAVGLPAHVGLRAAALGAAALLAAAAVGGVVVDAWETIRTLRHTAYPAGRLATGGGRLWWELFLHDLLVAPVVSDWGPLRNALQAASFWLLFPVIAAGLAVRASRPGTRLDPTALVLLAYVAFLATYCVTGLPVPAARLLFLGAVPTERAALGLGVAEVALLVRFLATRDGPDATRGGALAISLAWAGALALAAAPALRVLGGLTLPWLAGACAVNAAAAFALLRARRPAAVVGALAAVLVPCTLWFNPLVRGGTGWMLHNPVSQAVREIDAEAGGDTAWVVFNSDNFSNLLRALDVRVLGGVFPVPQLELFRRVDPGRQWEGIYNRYANAVYLPKSTPGVEFRLAGPDVFFVDLPLDAETLSTLGATHVAFVSERRETWDRLAAFEWIRSVGKFHFYRVRRPDGAGGAPSPERLPAGAAGDRAGSGSRGGGGR